MSDKERTKENVLFELGRMFARFGEAAYRAKMAEADMLVLKGQVDDLNAEYLLLDKGEAK